MNRITKTLTALCLFAAIPAYAGHGQHGSLVKRMEQQQDRIEQGIDSAQLTPREVKSLKREQREIRHLAHELREDGRLSKRDRNILAKKLDRADQHIWTLKHNDQRGYAFRERVRPLDAPVWRTGAHKWQRNGYKDI